MIRDLAVMLADGGDCLADLGALGDQESLFGNVASASTGSVSSIGSPMTRRAWRCCGWLTRRLGRVRGS